ncbi:hypothetical protein J6590_041451 [Homalodisca vitripennis]|nr:hypothetical protein J6590_041451 [Homalodisca vitripennis]
MDIGMEVEVETEAIKRKNGLKQIDYKCEVIKRARVKGLEYRNWKENVVQKKELNGQCRCKKKCCESLSEDIQFEVFTKLYSYDTKNEQDA